MSAIAQMLITSKNCDLTYNLVHHISHVCWHQVHLHMSKSTSRLLKYFNPSNPRRLFCSSSEMLLGRHILASNETEDLYKQAMAKVPQQVIVVTTGMYQDEPRTWIKRGVTCSTFSSVSLHPPIISFCLNQGRRMHNLIKTTGMFAVHILAQDQVSHGIHFSKPATDNVCQFDSVPHIQGKEGLPIILGSLAVLLCDSHSHHNVGDHTVWYGNVTGVSVSETLQEPLIYFTRQFRSIGDEIFLKAFEDATLPFENWTHEAHLRMAWNYIKELGKDEATPYIKLFIQKYNEKHRDKLKSHYHETITMFFIHLVSDAIFKRTNANETFEDFMSCNQHLMDKNLILEYYNKETLFQEQARNRFIYPDKKNLP
uniref:Flavin reductase like domain-containing protein n=1 Tax=Arion vulgaris TaxID=1028688 RepID=A0A0B7AXI6_9EUPU